MKKYNLYLSEQQINALTMLSEQKGVSVSELIRRALDEYTEKELSKGQSIISTIKSRKRRS
jgi:Ribbon-helix-helix protein, copG family